MSKDVEGAGKSKVVKKWKVRKEQRQEWNRKERKRMTKQND